MAFEHSQNISDAGVACGRQAECAPPAGNRAKVYVVLASASPRRADLLASAEVPFDVLVPRADESLSADLKADPPLAAKTLAERKASGVVQYLLAQAAEGKAHAQTTAVIGVDTMVVCEGEIFGKPKNLDDAKRMLRSLSGASHQVHTAVSLWLIGYDGEGKVSVGYRSFVDTAEVEFFELSEEDICVYLRKGESFDKAGAYAAQGEGRKLIKEIRGSEQTVIGLPLNRLLSEYAWVFDGAKVPIV